MAQAAYLSQALVPRLGEFIRLRRDLHAHPELAFEEHRTSALGPKSSETKGPHGVFDTVLSDFIDKGECMAQQFFPQTLWQG